MKLLHIALVNSSEENSDRFYRDLLGCEKQTPRQADAGLIKELFGLDTAATIINYADPDGLIFEVFIVTEKEHVPFSHACLAIADRDMFLNECQTHDIPVRRFEKPDGGSIVFITDFDRNLFEIKENAKNERA